MNSRSTNDSIFRFGHFPNSCLEFFDKVPGFETIEFSHVKEVHPSISLDKSSIDFEFETDGSFYLDMRDILQSWATKGKIDDFVKKDEHGKADMGMSFIDDDLHYITHANNNLHSLFSNCEVYLNSQQLYNSFGLYGHKALISNEFKASTRNDECILACHGYKFEKEPSDYKKGPVYRSRGRTFAEKWNYLLR